MYYLHVDLYNLKFGLCESLECLPLKTRFNNSIFGYCCSELSEGIAKGLCNCMSQHISTSFS